MPDAPEWPEWLKWTLGLCGGVSAWGLTLYFAKNWFEARVLEPIAELKRSFEDVRSKNESFMDKTGNVVLNIAGQQSELIGAVAKQVSEAVLEHNKKAAGMFLDALRETHRATKESGEALQKVNVLQRAAEENNVQLGKIIKIAQAVHSEQTSMKSEVVKLKNDMVIIKTRVIK